VQAGFGIVVLAGVAQVEGDFYAVAVGVFVSRYVAVRDNGPLPDRFGYIAGGAAQVTRGVGKVGHRKTVSTRLTGLHRHITNHLNINFFGKLHQIY